LFVCRTSPLFARMAESIIAELHGRLLRGIAVETSVHYQGLRAAASHLRRSGLLNSRLAKKLAAVDCAFAISRHITAVSAEQCIHEVISAIAYEVKAAAEEKGTKDEDYLEQVAKEKVEVDKVAEEEAAAKEKADLEQAVANKVAEEEAAAKEKTFLEQVAKEKVVAEKAAEQMTAKAKTPFGAGREGKGRRKGQLDAVMAAKDKVAEEQSAKEEADTEWLEEVEGILKSGKLADVDLTEDELHRLLVCRAKKAGHEAAKVKPVGAKVQVTEEAAEVQPDVAAMEQATEENASKKAKVDKFAKVDMELEALAHRIGSMPSPEELLSWRRSGWR
jgi:hypothetical protein